ncbi:polymeric immunoglobulin receptor, partial [Clarias magur]
MSLSVFSVLRRFLDEYASGTPSKIKVIDAYLLYMLLTGAFAFLYCLLVGTFPFNSFLSGFISCVGSFTLAGVLCTVTTVGDQKVFEGQSITILCHYNPEYTSHVKYWCQGSIKDFCSTLARTDQPEHAPISKARITIADDPTQHMFTVTMRELKEKDSGWYWCGVEIGGMWSKDSTASLYISVTQGISVAMKDVRGEEGGSVTVQFLYSEKHRENEKRWCRSGHLHSCKVTNNGTLDSEHLLINDDKKDTVTVTMRQLEMRDAGWYLCGAGEHQASVNVLVTPRPTTTATYENATQQHLSEVKTPDSSIQIVWQSVLIACGALLCLLVAGLVTWMIWERLKKIPNHRMLDEPATELT